MESRKYMPITPRESQTFQNPEGKLKLGTRGHKQIVIQNSATSVCLCKTILDDQDNHNKTQSTEQTNGRDQSRGHYL